MKHQIKPDRQTDMKAGRQAARKTDRQSTPSLISSKIKHNFVLCIILLLICLPKLIIPECTASPTFYKLLAPLYNLHNDECQTHFTILHVEYSGCSSYQVQDGSVLIQGHKPLNTTKHFAVKILILINVPYDF